MNYDTAIGYARPKDNRLYRWSKADDKDEIVNLLKMCFGDRQGTNAYEHIAGRYLCCIMDGKIVAVTGLCFWSEFKRLEIGWTCTHPNYRHLGVMQELFKRILATTDEDIYCSCWRIGDNKEVNLHTLMNMFNFKLAMPNLQNRDSKVFCEQTCKEHCVYFNTNGCRCANDLYVRYGRC